MSYSSPPLLPVKLDAPDVPPKRGDFPPIFHLDAEGVAFWSSLLSFGRVCPRFAADARVAQALIVRDGP